MTKGVLRSIWIAGAAVFISGCASTKQFVDFPNQSLRIENPKKVRIYVARPSSLGAAVTFGVKDNGYVIGKTGPKGFLCWERDPGRITVSGKAENTSDLTFNAEKGEVYYIKQSVGMGFFMARNYLKFMTENQGADVVAKCNPPKNVQ